ncbi:sensor histidine kinase [Streptomyces sp. NPDC101175]|uniref:sensor histidine kinase n=1 Tax=Streptomyces sp. NPDC101175 TaxID=3366123 RepID=UPI003837F1E0
MVTRASLSARLSGTNPLLPDAVLAVGLAATAAVAGSQYHPEPWPRFDALAYTLCVLVNLPLALRRRAPVQVLTACCVAFVGYLAAGYQPSLNFWAPAIALYSVAAHRPPRTALAGAALTAAVIFYSGLADGSVGVPLSAVQAVGVPAVVWLVGNGTRRLDDRNRQLVAVTAQLRREQEKLAQQAITEERVRIARELHDVVAHHLSVISVQAGLAGYVFTADPATAHGALGTIAATSREALEELRRMLTLLRVDSTAPENSAGDTSDAGDGRSYAPTPDLGGLGELTERVSAAGVPVRLLTEGTVRRLPAGVGLCA